MARARIAEGICCPSCMSWWATVAIRFAVVDRRVWSARWWVDTFAAWAVAAVITRKGG